MGKLVRYKDSSSQCWSRVDLENGDPIYISIGSRLLLIKKSNLGLLGTVLYKQSNEHKLRLLDVHMIALTDILKKYKFTTPNDIKTPRLKVFTQLAIDSGTLEDYRRKISDVLREAGLE